MKTKKEKTECEKVRPRAAQQDYLYALRSVTCHRCTKGVGEWCIKCRRVDEDERFIQQFNHFDVSFGCADGKQFVQPSTRRERISTGLSAETEDAMLSFLRKFIACSPIEVLMLHFVAQGGAPSRFLTHLKFLQADIYKEFEHSLCTVRNRHWGGLLRKFPEWARLRDHDKRGHRKPAVVLRTQTRI